MSQLERVGMLLTLGLAWGCASASAPRPAAVEARDATGFTITEKVRASGDARADFESGVRALEQKQYEIAIAELAKAVEAAPDATAAQIDLAIAYRETNDLARAEASLKAALALNSRHPVALNELGIVYRRTGRFAQARQSYEQVLALYPDFHYARRNLAVLCDLYLGDASCALEQYQRYVQAVPDDAQAAMWLADLRARAGK
jgi:Tfp pilus assembly protein PilF